MHGWTFRSTAGEFRSIDLVVNRVRFAVKRLDAQGTSAASVFAASYAALAYVKVCGTRMQNCFRSFNARKAGFTNMMVGQATDYRLSINTSAASLGMVTGGCGRAADVPVRSKTQTISADRSSVITPPSAELVDIKSAALAKRIQVYANGEAIHD